MERVLDMNEISDGKLYSSNDIVKADCQDCRGCSACCRAMGSSIVLDPYDIYCLEKGLSTDFQGLLHTAVELNLKEGIILPNLKMTGSEEKCFFNNEEGRCRIHAFRPGLCRLFPLGRFYENGSFRYYLQTQECRNKNRTKIKVKKWLGIPNLPAYEAFISQWHYFLKDITKELTESANPELARSRNLSILQTFFAAPWNMEEEFYPQFAARLQAFQ